MPAQPGVKVPGTMAHTCTHTILTYHTLVVQRGGGTHEVHARRPEVVVEGRHVYGVARRPFVQKNRIQLTTFYIYLALSFKI